MEVSLAVLADYANISQEGKLNILGIFNTVFVQSFPGGLPQCFLVIRLVAEVEEKGTQHQLQCRMTDPDGKWLTNLAVELSVPAEGPPGPPGIDLILPAAPLVRFERDGPHELKVFLDEKEQRAIKVTASRLPPPQGSSQ